MLGSPQMLQHALPVFDLAAAQTAGIGPVEAGRMGLEPIFLLAQREADDHDADCIVSP
jgi:hypothetical protein